MLRRSRNVWLAVTALVCLASSPMTAGAQPGEIKGQDVTGDREKSANDGWSQAPVPREESAAKDAPNPGGASTRENAERPVPKSGGGDDTASDPQKPMDHRTPNPSGSNPASPSK